MFNVTSRRGKLFDLTQFEVMQKGDRYCLVNHEQQLALTSFGNAECLKTYEYRYTDETIELAKARYTDWVF